MLQAVGQLWLAGECGLEFYARERRRRCAAARLSFERKRFWLGPAVDARSAPIAPVSAPVVFTATSCSRA